MNTLKYYTLAVLLSISLCYGMANDRFIAQLKSALKIYNIFKPEEKAYVQTDRTYYYPNDCIFFSIRLLDANNHRSSTLSDAITVELRDSKGNVVMSQNHIVFDGFCNGGLYINENFIKGGIYTIVAYTQWMKNFGEKTYFKKQITVQKHVKPNVLLKLDFLKRAYAAGDTVEAELKINDLQNQKVNNAPTNSIVRIAGVPFTQIQSVSKDGLVNVKFVLPQDLNTIDGILQIIVNNKGVEESITRSIPIVLNKIKLVFLPEGGDLIANVSGKLAFKAVNEFGKGADVSGEIIDQNGVSVANFSSFHLGMGAFEFTPQYGKEYKARILKPSGSFPLVDLPQIQENGYSLNLKEKKLDSLTWSVYVPFETKATLVGQSFAQIHSAISYNLIKGLNLIKLSTSEFPMGVAVFTLFDAANVPRCERLVMVNANKNLKIKISSDSTDYIPGSKVRLTIKTTDLQDKPVPAKLSLAVVDEKMLTLADDKQDDMLSYLFLSSELSGKIEEPSFYFNPQEPKANEAIDYLLLTQGWRRFNWEQVINQKQIGFGELPNRVTELYGYVVDKKGKPTQAKVYLLEVLSPRRIVELQTTKEGYFAFYNVNISNSLVVFTKLPNQVYLFNKKPIAIKNKSILFSDSIYKEYQDFYLNKEDISSLQRNLNPIDSVQLNGIVSEISTNIPQLNEQAHSKSDLVSAISTVSINEINTFNKYLNGRVSGFTPSSFTDSYLTFTPLVYKGISSMGSGQPSPSARLNNTWVLSSESLNAYGLINSSKVYSLDYFKNYIFNSSFTSSNGSVLIAERSTPFSRDSYHYQSNRDYGARSGFSYVEVPKKEYYNDRGYRYREYDYNDYNWENPYTLYWNPFIETDYYSGMAQVDFRTLNTTTTYRATLEGASFKGLIGSVNTNFNVKQPFSVVVKSPSFVALGDKISIPFIITNNRAFTKKIKLYVSTSVYNSPTNSYYHTKDTLSVIVPANSGVTEYLELNPKIVGSVNLYMSATDSTYSLNSNIGYNVRSIYYPFKFSCATNKNSIDTIFNLNGVLPASVKAEATCYLSCVPLMFDAFASIIREPHGCFEQVSSSTFPNISALQLMRILPNPDIELQKKAFDYVKNGYSRLAAYEVDGGGFSLYGKAPASLKLSAYGLIEFVEMKKVYDGVSERMLERTKEYLMKSRDGIGGFVQKAADYGYSGNSKFMYDAYVVFALSEAGEKDIQTEYAAALKEALKNKDYYRMALLANAAYNLKDTLNYKVLINFFNKQDISNLKVEASIMYSAHEYTRVEAVALWLKALLKQNIHSSSIMNCITYIQSKRIGNGYGTTQTTSLVLQSLAKYAELNLKENNVSGQLQLVVNDSILMSESLSKESPAKISAGFTSQLNSDINNIKFNLDGPIHPYALSVIIDYEMFTPRIDKECPLTLSTRLLGDTLKVNETVRLEITLSNTNKKAQPTPIAVIGIPGGMSLLSWQLKELQEKGVFDYYEIIDNNLVLYYTDIKGKEIKRINVDLKAELPGTYSAMASSAYLYYSPQFKYWNKGIKVEIQK